MLEVNPQGRPCRISGIMSTRTMGKMFKIKHLKMRQLNGIIIFVIWESIPLWLIYRHYFPFGGHFQAIMDSSVPFVRGESCQ